MPSELECTAFHEASHAVAFFLLKIPFDFVSIEPDLPHNRLGVVHSPIIVSPLDEGHLSLKTRDYVERRVIAWLAGFIGERMYYELSSEVGAATDFDIVCDFVQYLCRSPKEQQPYIDWLTVRSETLIEQNWNAVETLATALLRTGRITSRQTIRIIKTVIPVRL